MNYGFAPLPALIGGILIGLAASALLLFDGRIAASAASSAARSPCPSFDT